MKTTITLEQQRELLINQIAELNAKGEDTSVAEYHLKTLDAAKATGLKYRDSDESIYETFSYYYTSRNTGGKKWKNGHLYSTRWGVAIHNVYKKECFK